MQATKLRELAVVGGIILAGCQKSNQASSPHEHEQEHVVTAHDDQAHVHDHSQHVHDTVAAAAPLSAQSIYQLEASLTDQDGKPFDLVSLRGTTVLAAMFYASCTSVCPMLISQLKHIEESIPADTREHTQVLMVSLDPARDTPEKLKQLAQQHAVTDPRWHFVRTSPDTVRELAALLGIRYRQLPGGDIAHSPVIALLDRDGVVTARMENAADNPAQLLSALDHAVHRDVALAR